MTRSEFTVEHPPRTWFIFHTTVATVIGATGAVSVVHTQEVMEFSKELSLASGLVMSVFVAVVFHALTLGALEERAGVLDD